MKRSHLLPWVFCFTAFSIAASAQKAQVLQYWPLKQGDVYDAVQVPQFLLKYKTQLHTLDGWSASYKQFEHEDTHVVDLVVTFKQGGRLNERGCLAGFPGGG